MPQVLYSSQPAGEGPADIYVPHLIDEASTVREAYVASPRSHCTKQKTNLRYPVSQSSDTAVVTLLGDLPPYCRHIRVGFRRAQESPASSLHLHRIGCCKQLWR